MTSLVLLPEDLTDFEYCCFSLKLYNILQHTCESAVILWGILIHTGSCGFKSPLQPLPQQNRADPDQLLPWEGSSCSWTHPCPQGGLTAKLPTLRRQEGSPLGLLDTLLWMPGSSQRQEAIWETPLLSRLNSLTSIWRVTSTVLGTGITELVGLCPDPLIIVLPQMTHTMVLYKSLEVKRTEFESGFYRANTLVQPPFCLFV